MFLILLPLVFIIPSVINSQSLQVLSPPELRAQLKEGISADIANFGHIPYGQTLIGNILMTTPRNACSPIVPLQGDYNEPAPVVIVDRGQCSFVTKSFYSQLIGSKLCVIVDDRIENIHEIMMIDDGFGYNIHIPTIMISLREGEIIKKFLENNPNHTVTVSMQFELKHSLDKVMLEIWTSSLDKPMYDFIEDFSQYHAKIQESLEIKPHFALWFCVHCRDQNYTVDNSMCISGGRYCAPNSVSGNINGREIVFEDLRQICIHQNDASEWWTYAQSFGKMCLGNNQDITKCSYDVMDMVGIKKDKIQLCVKSSFQDSENQTYSENNILKEERDFFIKKGVQAWPTLVINNVTFRGSMTPSRPVYDAICTAFDLVPEGCLLKDTVTVSVPVTDHPWWVVFLVIVIVALLMIVVLYVYKRVLKKDMDKELSLQVNSAISQYFALGDRTKTGGTEGDASVGART